MDKNLLDKIELLCDQIINHDKYEYDIPDYWIDDSENILKLIKEWKT